MLLIETFKTLPVHVLVQAVIVGDELILPLIVQLVLQVHVL